MIVNKILGNIRDYEAGERTVDPVWLEWYELEKKLLRKTSEAGEEVGIRLEDGSHAHGSTPEGHTHGSDEEGHIHGSDAEEHTHGIGAEGHGHSRPMEDGDILYADDSRVIVVRLLPCEVTVIPVHTMKEMGRLCFELGNRHLSLSIGDSQVTVPYDEPTFRYLEKLGFHPRKQEGTLDHVTLCRGHSHG